MLNMTIEQFTEQLDELVDTREKILKIQERISCKALLEEYVYMHKEQILVEFAHRKGIPVAVAEDGNPKFERNRYKYCVEYRGTEFLAFSSGKTYENFRKEGLLQ